MNDFLDRLYKDNKPRFKKGDRVVCIAQPDMYDESKRILFEGHEYTIKSIFEGAYEDWYVTLENIERSHNFAQFRFHKVSHIPDELFEL